MRDFPQDSSGVLWLKEPSDQKYVICNADEGEPATNKDRVLMSGDPHSVIEGMAIAGYAVGGRTGATFICARSIHIFSLFWKEPLKGQRPAVIWVEIFFNSGFDFDIEVISAAAPMSVGKKPPCWIPPLKDARGTSDEASLSQRQRAVR